MFGLLARRPELLKCVASLFAYSSQARGAIEPRLLELVDAEGTTRRANDNWRSDQQAELEAIGIQPPDDRESALIETLAPGSYTAIVRGVDGGTGVGLVEVYNVQ